jgi:hypothetical protein
MSDRAAVTSETPPRASPSPLALDEYELATREFFSEAVDAVARASDPLLGQIQREQVEVLPPSVNTVQSGPKLYASIHSYIPRRLACRFRPVLRENSRTFTRP